ncbi:hypothetical protein BGZ65_004254, partial [Modicella reniformis]
QPEMPYLVNLALAQDIKLAGRSTCVPRSIQYLEEQSPWTIGMNGSVGSMEAPSIWCINKTFGHTWRQGPGTRIPKLHSFKKKIVESGLRSILKVQASTLMECESLMHQLIQQKISQSQYHDCLPKDPPRRSHKKDGLEDEQ